MAKAKLYNLSGEATREIELNDSVFSVTPKLSVVHQVYVGLTSNARQPWADSKDKSEVSGGGKKPWKQKGTGRARHGSIRSPIWKGGGVTFGPLSARNYTKKINKKMNALALRMCLSDKCSGGKLALVESLPETGKTKDLNSLLTRLPGAGRSLVILTDGKNESILRAAENMKKIKVVRAGDVNVLDMLNNQFLVATETAIRSLEKRLIS